MFNERRGANFGLRRDDTSGIIDFRLRHCGDRLFVDTAPVARGGGGEKEVDQRSSKEPLTTNRPRHGLGSHSKRRERIWVNQTLSNEPKRNESNR